MALAAGLTLVGCSGTPAGRATAASSRAQSTVSPPAKAVPFTGCRRIDGADLTAVAGVRWQAGSAVGKRLGCHVTLRTAVAGGSLDLDFQPSGTAQADVRSRLKELSAAHHDSTVVAIDQLRVGSLAGGVAYTLQGAASYVLYASTPTSVLNVVCNLPAGVAHQSTDVAALTATAQALLTWAVAHQPTQPR